MPLSLLKPPVVAFARAGMVGRVGAAQKNIADLLDCAPDREYALLELALHWPGLSEAQQRVASRLRLFVITRDPLDWIPGRGSSWATVYADGDTIDELPVYVLLDEVQQRRAASGSLPAAVAPAAGAAVRAAAELELLLVSGAYPAMAASGAAPRLLDRADEGAVPVQPSVAPCSDAWEPLGLGAIQDLVQEAFGPVDFDRSSVVLPHTDLDPACPACRGERFGFPGDLAVAQARMCRAHAEAASDVTDARIARARESNSAGWRAIGKASARINGLPAPRVTPLPPRTSAQPGRNDPCHCGSGVKYKRCCGA